jgi:polyisoprenoid-binding protein YceI
MYSHIVFFVGGFLTPFFEPMPPSRATPGGHPYAVDQQHSSLTFAARHWGVSRVRGSFSRWSGGLTLAPGSFERSTVTIIVDATSINTGNETRDAELRQNWFEADKHPLIEFSSSRVTRNASGQYVVAGDLTMKGVRKQVSASLRELGTFRALSGVEGRAFSAAFAIARKDFGVTADHFFEKAGAIADTIEIDIELQATPADPALTPFRSRNGRQSVGEIIYERARREPVNGVTRAWLAHVLSTDTLTIDARELGAALHRLVNEGRKSEAGNIAQTVELELPALPGLSRVLALVHLSLDNNERASQYLERARRETPSDAMLREYARAVVTPSHDAAQSGVTEVRVPRGTTVNVDGKLDAAEWTGAYEAALAGGARLLLRHDDKYLYLALKAEPGYPSVCVASGDIVRILHASAALGAGIYARTGAVWQRRQAFAFAMRSADVSEKGKAAQRDYLVANGWVATNFAMSRTDKEIQIALSLFDRNDPRLALGYWVLQDNRALAWPANVVDGCTMAQVVQGPLPAEARFEPRSWVRLRFVRDR